jgi:L-asparaginase II
MNRHPEMVAGTGGFCTELMRNTQGKLIGKIGAEGVYCIGIRNNNTGMAVKLEDGNMNRLPPVVIEVLKQLNVLTPEELKALDAYHLMDNLNDVGQKVGSTRPVFRLTRV